MSNIMKNYLAQIQKNLSYRATWEPHRPMKIGAYGKIHQGIFSEYGNLEELNVPLSIEKLKTTHKLVYKSEQKASFTLKAKGEINPIFQQLTKEEAGIHVVFKKENGILFTIQGITYLTLNNKVAIAKFLKELLQAGKWEPDFLIVTEILQAEKTSIVLSKKKNSELEIKFDADLGTDKKTIGELSFLGEIMGSQGLNLQFTSTTNSTPLYRLSKLKEEKIVNEKNRNLLSNDAPELVEIEFEKSEMLNP